VRPLLLILISLLLVSNTAVAEPYLPQDKNLVLVKLPETLTSNRIEMLVSKLRQRTVNEEQDETLLAELIDAYITQAKLTGDMRYISYAQDRLNKWLQQVPGSEKARLSSAYILQYNHNFEQAIIELESLLKDYPENIGAWSLLSDIQLLTGDHDAAKASCRQLSTSSSLADTMVCQSNIMTRTGSLDRAYKVLSALLSVSNTMPLQQQIWLNTSLAEIKIQQDDYKLSAIHIEYAMKLARDNNVYDSYLTRLYIDYLVHDKRYDKALVLAQNNNNDISLMIRAAVIAKKIGDDKLFNRNKEALVQLFETEQRRGQSRHIREQALFTLLILDDPVSALELARHNWMLQKEPEDARILMKSALASSELLSDETQLQQARTVIEKTGLIDHRLDKSHLQDSLL
jgi:tetratricopeptide (TPR) repeat protein